MFCHPPGNQVTDAINVQPIKFYFTDQTRVGTTAAGENAVVKMVGSLYDTIEDDFGSAVTRLYRAFRPKSKTSATWKWRQMCCLPYVVIFEFCFCNFLIGISVLTIYLVGKATNEYACLSSHRYSFFFLKLISTVLSQGSNRPSSGTVHSRLRGPHNWS